MRKQKIGIVRKLIKAMALLGIVCICIFGWKRTDFDIKTTHFIENVTNQFKAPVSNQAVAEDNEETTKIVSDDGEALRQLIVSQVESGNDSFAIKFTDEKLSLETVFDRVKQAIKGTYVELVIDTVKVNGVVQQDKNQLVDEATLQFTLRHTSEQQRELNAWAERLAQEMTELSPREKAKKIHDTIIKMASYSTGDKKEEIDGISVYSPYAILKEGKGVCQAYAALFQLAADKSGLPSRVITGYVQETNTQSGGDHAWNEVYIDGKWREVDTTWDDPINGDGTISYTYFLKNLSELRYQERQDSIS